MKKILIICLLLAFSMNAAAQIGWCKFDLGIHLGLDLGAAVPWPLAKAISGDDKMNAVPQLTPGLGLSGEYHFDDRWSAVAEATYKSVGLDASIITLNSGQKFKNNDGLNVVFRGKAKTTMSFTMLEVPLSVKFRLSENNRVFLGGYYAYIVNGKFNATAMSGYLENPESGEITVVYPDKPLDNDFSSNLRHWDIGWHMGYERKILNRLTLSGKFSMGLVDIFKRGENYLDYSMLNMRGTLALSYRLF